MGKMQLQQKSDDHDIPNLENSLSSSHDQSNDQTHISYIEDIPDNIEIPFQDHRKSFSVFNHRNKPESLKSFIKIKSHSELENLNSAIAVLQHDCEQSINLLSRNNNQINENKNPQEFFSPCKVPSNTTLFIHIFSVDNKRCNISITNVSGYVIAYLTDIMPSRKFYKIYKILTKLGNKPFFIINDEYQSISKDSNFVKKISDYAPNFCYYTSLDDSNISKKFLNFNLQKEKLIPLQMSKKQKPTYFWIQDHIFWYFSQIFTKKQQDFNSLLKQMKRIQHQIQNPVFIRGLSEIKDPSMDFMIKSILINLSKLKRNKTTSQLLCTLKDMMSKYEDLSKGKAQPKFGNPLYHFPEQIKASKQCVHCQNNKNKIVYSEDKQFEPTILQDKDVLLSNHCSNKKQKLKHKSIDFPNSEQIYEHKKSKTKYRCEGCSAQARKDIALCLDCFEDYHTKKQLAKKKNIKKAEYAHEMKKQKILSQIQKSNKKSTLKNNLIDQLSDSLQKFQKQKSKDTSNKSFQQKTKNQSKASSPQIDCQQHPTMKKDIFPSPSFQGWENCVNGPSEDEESQYSLDTCNKLKQLQSNDEYIKLLQKLDMQKKKFFQIFQLMMKNQNTKKVATTTAEYVKFKALNLLDQTRK